MKIIYWLRNCLVDRYEEKRTVMSGRSSYYVMFSVSGYCLHVLCCDLAQVGFQGDAEECLRCYESLSHLSCLCSNWQKLSGFRYMMSTFPLRPRMGVYLSTTISRLIIRGRPFLKTCCWGKKAFMDIVFPRRPSHTKDSIILEVSERRATSWQLECSFGRPPLKISVSQHTSFWFYASAWLM